MVVDVNLIAVKALCMVMVLYMVGTNKKKLQ